MEVNLNLKGVSSNDVSWKATYYYKGKTLSKSFSISIYGDKAQQMAIDQRLEWENMYDAKKAATKKRMNDRFKAKEAAKQNERKVTLYPEIEEKISQVEEVRGVTYNYDNMYGYYWIARMIINGERISQRFYVKVYGYDKAYYMAVKQKLSWEQETKNEKIAL